MFERFTERARDSVVRAQQEARLLAHSYIGTEHLLLGLLADPDALASRAMRSVGLDLAGAHAEVVEIIGRGDGSPTGHIPFTPRAKKVLELSLREALKLGHNYIGTEHILLGLIREGEGVAAQVLVRRGIALERARAGVHTQLAHAGAEPVPRRTVDRTPAAEQAVADAEQLAGSAPMGSHHLLEALARSEGSLAAKALVAAGVNADALAALIDQIGLEDTTDLTPEEAASRQMELRVDGDEVHIVLRDQSSVATAHALLDQLGQPVLRGDDGAAGPMVGPWRAINSYLATAQTRLAPAVDDEGAQRRTGASLVQRAIQSRLRRRAPRPPDDD